MCMKNILCITCTRYKVHRWVTLRLDLLSPQSLFEYVCLYMRKMISVDAVDSMRNISDKEREIKAVLCMRIE